MKTYELTYIISPEITSEEATAEAKSIESAVQNKEGIILKQSNPIAKTLSYPIKNRASGFLGAVEFQIEPEKLTEVKEIIVKNEKVVRHMLIIKEAAKIKRGRRIRTKMISNLESEQKPEIKEKIETEHTEQESSSGHKGYPASEGKEKVELKDIEQRLEEILGE